METKENQNLIVKCNNLIEASYRLTSVEQKIILTLVSIIKKDDKEFQRYRFKTSEFLALLGIHDQSKYKEIPEIAEGLMKKILTIREGKSTLKVAWLSGVKVLHGDGIVEMEFSPYLKPYLLQLKERFTSYKLQEVIQLKSAYSVRIYELLKQYEKIGERIFELEKLRYILAIEEDEYNLYSDFKKRIILKAQQELKAKTDILFEFEEIKTGRKVTSLRFYIWPNTKDEICVTAQGNEQYEEVQDIFLEDITPLEAKQLMDAANADIRIIREKYEIAKQTNHIDNLVAWLVTAIKQDYQMPKSRTKSNRFNDYDQRQYDIKKLEKGLLGMDEEE